MKLALGMSLPSSNKGGGGVGDALLLDEYSGAAAAYSLRNLSSSTTNVIRVRESGADAEQDFTSSEITDGTLTTFTGSNDGYVTTWYDQSGNGINVTQTTAINQPQIVSSGSVILDNGKPTVSFDGANDALFINSVLSGNDYNLFAVMNQTSTTYAYGLSSSINNSLRWNGSTLFLRGISSDISYSTGVLGQSLYYNIQASTSFIYIDTGQVATGINGSTSLSRIHLGERGGASANSTIKIQEFVIYLTDQFSNKDGIENNINNHYTIY
jgi:hypothetical protein